MKIKNFIITFVSAIVLILSPTTFAKDATDEDSKSAIAEINVIIKFFIFIYLLCFKFKRKI